MKNSQNTIEPVRSRLKRPLWSVMIPTFNPNEKYLKIAIDSVIKQEIGIDKMQIEVVDDCSNKVDVEKIVNDNWKGRVNYYRLPKNVGHSFNFTESIRRSKGELIHLLHDDDLVKPGFYNTFGNIFSKYEEAGAVFCRQEYIDEEGNVKFYSEPEMNEQGILDDALIKLAQKQRIQYCAMAVRRKVFEDIGGFITKNIGCEDWEMWVRIAKHYAVAYEPRALACYRVHHGTSMTLKDMRSGQDMRYMRESINIFTEYLPKDKREEVDNFRRKIYGEYSFNNAKRLFEEFNDAEGAAAQLSETIKMNSEVVFANKDLISEFTVPIKGAGVSVLIFTKNNEDIIERTLRNLVHQKVPDYIPWEVIITDSNSTDNTLKIAENILNKIRGNFSYRIIINENSDLFQARNNAVMNSQYDFIIFCNPGDFLNPYYIKNASQNMMEHRDTGIIGGYSEPASETEFPAWFREHQKDIYDTGEQYEVSADITWSRGYVWNSGMVLRKEAWESIRKKNFQQINENTGKTNYAFEKELCAALKLSGWRILYNVDLNLTKFIPAEKLSWDRLRELNRQRGAESFILSEYNNNGIKRADDLKKFSQKKKFSIRKEFRKSLDELKKIDKDKLNTYNDRHFNDSEILKADYHIGRLREIIDSTKAGSYNKKLRYFKKYFTVKYLKTLKYLTDSTYFRFPQYNVKNDNRGVSVILNYKDSSFEFLKRCLIKLSEQDLPSNFKWEIILLTTNQETEFRANVKHFWKTLGYKSVLRIVNLRKIDRNDSVIPALKHGKYDTMIFLNEFLLIKNDYIRIAYKVINKKWHIGLVGGRINFEGSVKTPGWFRDYKMLYQNANQYNIKGDLVKEDIDLCENGFTVKKFALKQITGSATNFIKKNTSYSNSYKVKSTFAEQVLSSGWKIIYEPRLELKKIVSVKQLSWEYLRDLNFKEGILKARTEMISALKSGSRKGLSNRSKTWIYKANQTLGEINRYPLKKIFSGSSENAGDVEVLKLEYLKGQFRELISKRGKYTFKKTALNGNGSFIQNGYETGPGDRIKNGVSIVICCYNSSKVLPQTLRHIIKQKVSDNIPWEVIIVDNASTDNTSQSAEKFWESHNCLAAFKIVKESVPGLSAARRKGIDVAQYDYVILCDDDNRLDENFVSKVYNIMSSDDYIGVLGGQSKAEFETMPKKWFDPWQSSFAIGEQHEKSGDITWTRGYVWGAAMVIRKHAWKRLLANGFNSKLTDRKGNQLSAGGDTEICYAMRNEGWKIRYESELKFVHYITNERLKWEYLRKLFRGFGTASAGLDEYIKRIPSDIRKRKKIKIPKSSRKELYKSIKILRETRYKRLLALNRRREGDPDIPMIEYTAGRIESILKTQKSYNRGLKLLKKVAYKSDFRYLSSIFRNFRSDFPRYKTVKKLNGVSVIVCTYNGADRLADTIRHIAKQKVDPAILWEVILVDNASTDNSKEVTKAEWSKHKCRAKLIIVDQPLPGKQLALEKGYEVANYEYWITCDDDNWLDENFVQLTYEIMSSNDKIGALGGPNEALCEQDPPEWFKWFQKDYAAGPQGDIYTGKVSEGDITWKRGFVWGAGMVVRKSAWEKLLADGFRTSMSCRKGTELSSGGDSEACYALVLAGWHIWYDKRLKLKHCMPAGRLNWDYLTRLFSGFGVATVGLELYEKAIKLGHADKDEKEILSQNWKYEFKKTIRELRKYGLKKILALRHAQDGNTEIPMLEFYLAKLKELWKDRKEYDEKFKIIINAPWKKKSSELRNEHRKFLEKENDFRYGWPWSKESFGYILIDNFTLLVLPKISILTPSFNSEATIEKAILSVLNQGYPNFEHIICDGGSTDGTVEILKKYPHLKWQSGPDKGQSDAMNKAFEMSTGEIISYLNADDYYSRGSLFRVAEEFLRYPETEMVVGNLFFEFENHTFTRNAEIDYKKIMLPFKYMFPINPVSYFYKRKVQTDVGPFPLDNHFTMDYWFLLKAYQNHKLSKIEEYLGTFCMNGYNKTSNADNRKNTHIRVLYHCWHYDKSNLLYYLYNYYKFFYYDKSPYNLNKLWNKTGKNITRIYSVITLRKNKYYNEKLYQKARECFYSNNRFKAAAILFSSYIVYPKALKQKSRLGLFAYSLFGIKNTEKLKWYYFFLTTPPGLPLGNKLYYYANEFKKDNKSLKGNSLLLLTYLVSPKFMFKEKHETGEVKKSGFKLRYLNPLYWLKSIVNFFRFKKYKEISYNLYIKSAEKLYFHKNFQSVYYMMLSFIIYPFSLSKKSRLNHFAYSALGDKNTTNLKILYHVYKDNPEYSLAHKLRYYGNDYKSKGKFIKGSMIMFLSYLISPAYIFNSSNKPLKSKLLYYLNPLNWLRGIINFFRFKKYKEISYNYYIKAGEKYYFHKNVQAVFYMLLGFLIYPLSLTKKSRLNLFLYSFLGNTFADKIKFMYHLYKDNPEYTFAHKLNYYGNQLRKEGSSLKGNSILVLAYILSPKYIKQREKIDKSRVVFVSESEVPKMDITGDRYSGLKQSAYKLKSSLTYRGNISEKLRNLPEIIRYRMVQVYHYFRYRKFKAKSKELYARAQESYIDNRRLDTVKLLIPSFLLYPVSIFKRNKWSLMYNSLFGSSDKIKPDQKPGRKL